MGYTKKAWILLLVLLPLVRGYAQNGTTYDSLWNKVEDLVSKKGLPASALIEVKKIYTLAKNRKDEAQRVKAFIYQLSLQERVTENGERSNISDLEKEVSS